MLCADLVEVRWKDQTGKTRQDVANLEDISEHGAGLQMELPIPVGSLIEITYPKGQLAGEVKYCNYNDIGYFLGIEFTPGSAWSQEQFKPQHLLDPRRLMLKASKVSKKKKAPCPDQAPDEESSRNSD
jgi:hypothetical protein